MYMLGNIVYLKSFLLYVAKYNHRLLPSVTTKICNNMYYTTTTHNLYLPFM